MAYYYNPFAKQESHGRGTVLTHKILALLSWALVVIFGIHYSVSSPSEKHGHTIWEQADIHPTPFSQSNVVTVIFWVLLLLTQVGYMWHLFSKETALVTIAANVSSHFILNNLFVFAFIMLWVRSQFWAAEIILIFHLISQTTAYWVRLGSPAFVHFPAIAGPYAWTLTVIFWNGAVAVNSNSLPARLVANIFIWVIFLIGIVHIFVATDYLLGYALSLLTLSLAIKQFDIKIIALQWIFAFVIFAVFLLGSLYISTVLYYDRDVFFKRVVEPEPDREREPLLNPE